jgi:hypothetical protein
MVDETTMFRVFAWRALLDFCIDATREDEPDRVECLHRMLPSMRSFVDLITR